MPHAWWLVISVLGFNFVSCNPTTSHGLRRSEKYPNIAPQPPIYNTLSDDVEKYPPSEYTEQIFLPIAAKNYHPQKTHETLSREPSEEFDVLNFSAYTMRPPIATKPPQSIEDDESQEATEEDSRESLPLSSPPKDFPEPSFVTFYGKILPRVQQSHPTAVVPMKKPLLKGPRVKPRRSMKNHFGNLGATNPPLRYYEYPTATPPSYHQQELRATKQSIFGDVEFFHPTVGRARDVDRARLVQMEDTTEKSQKYTGSQLPEGEKELEKKILYDDIFYHPVSTKKYKRKTPKLLPYQQALTKKPPKPNDGDFSFIVFSGDKNTQPRSAKLTHGVKGLKNFPGKKRERGIITNTTKVYYNFEHTHKPNRKERNSEALASDNYETTLPNPEVSDATERYSSRYRTPHWEDQRGVKSTGQVNPPFLPTVLTPLVRIERPNTEDYGEYDDLKGANSDQKSEKQQSRDSDSVQQYFQDLFRFQLEPHTIEFGHVMENPRHWEERYERNDMKNHRHQGKVRWGDKEGGFGEHVWDLNHHKPESA